MLEEIIQQVQEARSSFKGDLLFYRGHADVDWSLTPGLARRKRAEELEQILYYDFITRAGTLLPSNASPWQHLFAMQHHGLPTRLLDWTTTFGVALYFAMKECAGDAAIWVMDPFELNKRCWTEESIPAPDELEANYYEAFIIKDKKISCSAVAISPTRENPRLFNQKAAFTLHVDLKSPLEDLCPSAVKKIVIESDLLDEAREFLRLAGISEFSLFPDLDGLARDLLAEHFD